MPSFRKGTEGAEERREAVVKQRVERAICILGRLALKKRGRPLLAQERQDMEDELFALLEELNEENYDGTNTPTVS